MVRINSVKKNAAILVGAAALGAVSGANAAAIPAGQGQGNAAILDIEASVLRLPVSPNDINLSLEGSTPWITH